MRRHLINQNLFTLILLIATISQVAAQDIEKINLKKPIQLSGTINLQLESYSANGIENRKQPFSWMISGTPVLTILGVQMPFSFLFSNFENRYYHPFNQ